VFTYQNLSPETQELVLSGYIYLDPQDLKAIAALIPRMYTVEPNEKIVDTFYNSFYYECYFNYFIEIDDNVVYEGWIKIFQSHNQP